MSTLSENLYDVLFQPHAGMKNMAEEKNVGQALSVFFLSTLLPVWTVSLSLKTDGLSMMIEGMILLKLVAGLMIWIIGTAILHLAAEFFGGRGTAVGLFTALGFAHIPRIFIVPVWAVITVMPPGSKTMLLSAAVLMVVCWSLYLDAVAIGEVHQLSMAKSVLVLITPILFIGILCITALIFMGSAMIHMPMGL